MSEETATLIDNLNSIKDSKLDIKQALIDKGQPATDVFSTYADLIGDIETGVDTSDATATASDIKEGKTAYVDGEKITGIYVDEDLTDVLDAQDQKIAELEQSLENKTAGGEVKLNVYAQTTEPTNKDGIWLQTDKEFENVVIDENAYQAGEWSREGAYSNIPYVTSYGPNDCVWYSGEIYMFGTIDSNSGTRTAYKYNPSTDIYTRLTDIPFDFCSSKGECALYNNEIYFFGVDGIAYKYDIETDTYTNLGNISYNGNIYAAITVGNMIYLFIYYMGTSYAYKYDISKNKCISITAKPYGGYYSFAYCTKGTDIYFIGGSGSSNKYRTMTKYDTLTDTYTQLTSVPAPSSSGYCVSSYATCVGTNIYIFGGYQQARYYFIYDILTDTYTTNTISDSANYFYLGKGVNADNKCIYLLGSNSDKSKIYSLAINDKEYEDKSVIIAEGKTYNTMYRTELISASTINKLLYPFADVWYSTVEDGIDDTIPTYYGDGTQWIKFKN